MKKHFKYLILITLSLMILTGLVYAQPVDIGKTVQPVPFDSNPTAYANDGMNPASTGMMWDGVLGTAGYIYVTGTTGTAYFELSGFKTTTGFDPGWVEIKMKYDAAATTDDEYKIDYSTDGSTWVDLQTTVSGTDAVFATAIRPWSQKTEPQDGTWSWSDISNLRVRFFCTRQPPGPFPPPAWDNSLISIYEVWVTVHPLPLPPSSTAVSVQPPGVMSVKPYDAFFTPMGPDGFFFVEVYVAGVTALSGYEFTISFDTTVVSYKDAWSYWPWVDVVVTPDEAAGLVNVVATAEPPIVDVGFTGNSAMSRVYFTVDAYGGGGHTAYGGEGGTTDLELVVSKLGAPGGVPISHDVYDGWFSGPQFMSYQGSLFPGGDPTGTDWHEIYPDYCKMWHVKDWEDDPDSPDDTLSASDQIAMTNETGWTYWYHVDEVTTTIHWTFKPDEVNPTGELAAAEPYMPVDWPMTSPIGTYWHQIYGPPPPGSPEGTSGHCRWFEITSHTDTNGNDQFDPSDQFDFYYFDEGVTYWAHLDDVTTDIIVSQKPIEPEPPILEFPLGIGFIMALAPIIPLIYLWRRKVWKK